jgi:hypothetical protein
MSNEEEDKLLGKQLRQAIEAERLSHADRGRTDGLARGFTIVAVSLILIIILLHFAGVF